MIVGLTGGIGAGKSTVADLFAKRGAIVIRADEISHQVIEQGNPGYDQVVTRFGELILDSEKNIIRPKLAEIVFKDKQALLDLENIIHPLVRTETNRIIEQLPPEAIVINEVPLLLEKKLESLFEALVIVISTEKNRLERITQRGLTEEQAKARIIKQVDDEQRKSAADYLISNDGNFDQLESDVERVWEALVERNLAK